MNVAHFISSSFPGDVAIIEIFLGKATFSARWILKTKNDRLFGNAPSDLLVKTKQRLLRLARGLVRAST
jgi:hypothetical protein